MEVLGLDLSTVSTGVATRKGAFAIRPVGKTAFRRSKDIALGIRVCLVSERIALAVIEAPAFNAEGRGRIQLAELCGMVKLVLFQHGVPWVSVAPSQVKLYATGNGRASKEQVLAAALCAGMPAPGRKRAYDEADAFWLRQMGLHHFGVGPMCAMEDSQVAVIGRIPWAQAHRSSE